MSAATANQLRQHFDRELTEKQFQQAVVNLAQAYSFRIYHTWRSDRSPKGFPDLVLVKGGRLIFAELKTEKGKVTAEQAAWAVDLANVDPKFRHVAVYLWRPSDWPDIERVLAGNGGSRNDG